MSVGVSDVSEGEGAAVADDDSNTIKLEDSSDYCRHPSPRRGIQLSVPTHGGIIFLKIFT